MWQASVRSLATHEIQTSNLGVRPVSSERTARCVLGKAKFAGSWKRRKPGKRVLSANLIFKIYFNSLCLWMDKKLAFCTSWDRILLLSDRLNRCLCHQSCLFKKFKVHPEECPTSRSLTAGKNKSMSLPEFWPETAAPHLGEGVCVCAHVACFCTRCVF